jgi:uncharacterized protein YcbX
VRTVSRISITPVQGFALAHPEAVELGEHGVLENRRFFLADGEGNRLRSSATAWPCRVHAEYDAGGEVLRTVFPDGTETEASALGNGERLTVSHTNRVVSGQIVHGPWEEPLEALAGHPVRIVRSDVPGARLHAPVTLLSDASVERLGLEATRPVDARRFRMLFTLAGCEDHEEDGWQGRLLSAGEALLRVGGPVERCAVTTRDPDTGETDLDTLRLIGGYRDRGPGEAVYFGVYASVERPGSVRLGDRVEVLS